MNAIGQTFGDLTCISIVRRRDKRGRRVRYAKVRCACGTKKTVRFDNLRYGKVTSCGCWRARRMKNRDQTDRGTQGPRSSLRAPGTDLEFCYAGQPLLITRADTRLAEKVDQRGPDDCWPWTGSVSTSVYGDYGILSVKVEGREFRVQAHRLAYWLANGPIPERKLVRHRCHNTRCCNPAHLAVGTVQDNSDDMVKAGRSRWRVNGGLGSGPTRCS